jgi:hypothetical protein
VRPFNFQNLPDRRQLPASLRVLSWLNSANRALGARFVMSTLIARLHDAAVTPEAWPDALTALTDAAGVAGAALIIFQQEHR